MLFSEIYGAYYNTLAAVITEAISHPVDDARIRKIVEEHAFGESIVSIPEALKEERWQLLKADGSTPVKEIPSMPLSTLQKRWLKAVSCDPRVKLFGDFDFGLDGIEPLFLPSDVIAFDKYLDGDDYTDENYIANFRLILDAIKNKYPLTIESLDRKGNTVKRTVIPDYLEYSEKDDKFRLIGANSRFVSTINLGRIISCKAYDKAREIGNLKQNSARPETVVFELTDRRNALERVLLHFAHFEKTAERLAGDRYTVSINYDKADETEIVIRILSFGPMIKVTAPQYFVDLIKQRLIDQKGLSHKE